MRLLLVHKIGGDIVKKEGVYNIINIILWILIIGLALYLIISFIQIQYDSGINSKTGASNELSDDEFFSNDSEKIKENYEVDGLVFKSNGISYSKKTGSSLEVTVTNVTEEVYYLNGFAANIYDDNNNKIDSISVFGYKSIEINETVMFVLKSSNDLSKNAYRIEYIPSYQKLGD